MYPPFHQVEYLSIHDCQGAGLSTGAHSPIFEPPVVSLPRGPHGLTRAEVARSQRSRLLCSFTELLAERGYAGVRVGELVERARVSRATFYEHFADKQECLLAAYDHFAAAVADAITLDIGEHVSWRTFVETTLAGYLGALQRDLVAARAFLIEMDAAGFRARGRRRESMHAFATLLAGRHAAIRARDSSLASLPSAAYLALALAVRETARDALECSADPDLLGLIGDLTVLATALVEGAAAADPTQARSLSSPRRVGSQP